eukprot:superscaffoldBa00000266_g3328
MALYADMPYLDPRNFHWTGTSALPQYALQDLSKCLLRFGSRAMVKKLESELKSLAGQWSRLKVSPPAEYKSRTLEDGSGGEEDDKEEFEIVTKSCASGKECPLCCYQILRWFNTLTDAYHILGLAYKFFPTLTLTQVA